MADRDRSDLRGVACLLIFTSLLFIDAQVARAQVAWQDYDTKDCRAQDLWYSGNYYCFGFHGLGSAMPVTNATTPGGEVSTDDVFYFTPGFDRQENTFNYFSLEWNPPVSQGEGQPGWTFVTSNGLADISVNRNDTDLRTIVNTGDLGVNMTIALKPPTIGSGKFVCTMKFTMEPYWEATCLNTDTEAAVQLNMIFKPNLGQDPTNPSGPCAIETLLIEYILSPQMNPTSFQGASYYYTTVSSFRCTWQGWLEGVLGSVTVMEPNGESDMLEEDAPAPEPDTDETD